MYSKVKFYVIAVYVHHNKRFFYLINQQNYTTTSLLLSCLSHFSTLKMHTMYSSTLSADFYRITRFYIPEDTILNNSNLSLTNL
jgi:hypothetical protein